MPGQARQRRIRHAPLRSRACRDRCRSCAARAGIFPRWPLRTRGRDRRDNAASHCAGFHFRAAPAPSRHSPAPGWHAWDRPLRDRLQYVHGRGEADVLVDLAASRPAGRIAGMQHEAAAGIDRAALEHLHRLRVLRHLDLVRALDNVELHQKLRKVDAPCGVVDDDAHRAFGGMRAHVDDRTLEARIAHHRHGDQHLAVEIALVRRIVPDAGLATPGRFGALPSGFIRKGLSYPTLSCIGCVICQSSSMQYITSNSMVCAERNL